MAGLSMKGVGDYIREQRHAAQVSVRQLARLAGVSNPYLSQIERGLRKPSAEILQSIAKALRISAEQLYVQAGILTERAGSPEVVAAILADVVLTERQKQVLLEIYESFCGENAARVRAEADQPAAAPVDAGGGTSARTGGGSTPIDPDGAPIAGSDRPAVAADPREPAGEGPPAGEPPPLRSVS